LKSEKIIYLTQFLIKLFSKQRVFSIFFGISIFGTIISFAFINVDFGDKSHRLFKDITIFIEYLTLHIFSILLLLNYFEREKRGGIFIFPISSGASREEYFFSLYISQITLLTMLFLAFVSTSSISILLFSIDVYFLVNLACPFLSATLFSVIILALSQYISPLKAIFYSIILLFFGNGLDELYFYSYHLKPNEDLQILYEVLSKIIPNFYIFDGENSPIKTLFHWSVQTLIFLILGLIKFRKKVLRVEN
jgi:hypothetical protein